MEIGIWGDSITYGAGDTQGLGWAGRFRNHYFSDDSVSVYNRGVCGDTSGDILKRFPIEAASIEPDRILFAFGTNDCKYPAGSGENKVSREEFLRNIQELLKEARKYTEDIIFIGTTPANPSIPTESGSTFKNEDLKKYNEYLREVSRKEGLRYIDIFDSIDPKTDLFDYVHPNEKGYEKMYQSISQSLASTTP